MSHISPNDPQTQQLGSDISIRTHLITFFPDEYAASKDEEEWTLPDLAGEILDRRARSKSRLPWLKMARFGEKRTEKNCLRHNANTLEVTGIEIDYDSGIIPFDAAVDLMRGANVRCLLYTSASYIKGEKERWRILVPLSEGLKPAQREAIAESVNAIIGGVATRESFVLSTSYFYGCVKGNETNHRVEVLDGDFINLRPDLLAKRVEAPPIERAKIDRPPMAPGVTPGRDEKEIKALLKASRKVSKQGEKQWHNAMLQATASMIGKGWTDAAIYAACEPYCDRGFGDDDIAELIAGGRAKWQTSDPGKVIGRIGPIVAAAIEARGGEVPEFEPNWRERYVTGYPKASLHNARLAIVESRIICREDVFHNKRWIGSQRVNEVLPFIGEVTDARLLGLRVWLSNRYGFDLTEKYLRDAVMALARDNCFNPVADMLAEAEANWDGVKRLDRMAADYFNGEDTPLNSAFVRKVMIAAAARARDPGIKFDTIFVMESPEGWNKSSVWALLAGPENFSDERVIGLPTREVQEQLEGVWIHESADLAGMRKAEVEAVKAFASRQVDRARPAYGHFLVSQPRNAIEVGTTNADSYLQSQSGNRRFWPMKVLRPINLEPLKIDRMQLWGEAAHYESNGESLVLPNELWGEAAWEQESRRVSHPWEDTLKDLSPVVGHVKEVGQEWRVSSAGLFTFLDIKASDQKRHAKELAEIMRILGWTYRVFKEDGKTVRGYIK